MPWRVSRCARTVEQVDTLVSTGLAWVPAAKRLTVRRLIEVMTNRTLAKQAWVASVDSAAPSHDDATRSTAYWNS